MDPSTWTAKATKDNKGRPPSSLSYRPEPSLQVGPLATEAPAPSRGVRTHRDWLAFRTLDAPTAKQVRADLDGGLDGIRLNRRAFRTARELAQVLKSVELDKAHWAFADGDFGSAAAMVGLWKGLGLTAPLNVDFGLDPIGRFGRDGFIAGRVDPVLGAGAELAAWSSANHPMARTFVSDASIWHAAGADDTLALGLGLSTLASYLRAMDALGMSSRSALGQVGLRMAVGGRFLLGTASVRAARRLVDRVGELCGADVHVPITATTAYRELTQRSPSVNILRITASAFGAITGGADIVDLPTHGSGDPEEARLARNVHNILRDEAHLARVADPAGGAYAIEQLTDSCARAAWARFQEVEALGGTLAALRAGWVSEQIRACKTRRRAAIRSRSQGILGVSRFPDLDDDALARDVDLDEPTAVRAGLDPVHRFVDLLPHALRESLAALDEARVPTHNGSERCPPCTPERLSKPFERFQRRPSAPKAFIAPLGPLAAHTARTAFGVELLATGGIRATVGEGETVEQSAADFAASGCKIAVVSATGKWFDEHALALIIALVGQGASVWVLGDPGEQRAAFEAAGAAGFLHWGIDVHAAIKQLWEVR